MVLRVDDDGVHECRGYVDHHLLHGLIVGYPAVLLVVILAHGHPARLALRGTGGVGFVCQPCR